MTKVNWIFLQSFRDDQLRFFNRDHDAATGMKAIGTENAKKYSIVLSGEMVDWWDLR